MLAECSLDAVANREVSVAWKVLSYAAESSLIEAFCASGGPILVKGFVGSRVARFKKACIGGPKVRKTSARRSVDLYRCSSIAPVVDLQRRLMSIIGMQRKSEGTLSISLQCEISVQQRGGFC